MTLTFPSQLFAIGSPRPRSTKAGGGQGELTTAERQLVRFVGPMARILVRQAAAHAQDTRALYALLADHIDDAKERERFARLGVPEASGSRIRILPFHFGSRRSSHSRGASAAGMALEL